MPVRITGTVGQIAEAVKDFSAAYHADFAEVRELARGYLTASQPSEDNVMELARQLRCVLGSWGAGKREAPQLRGREDFANVLRQPELHATLRALGRTPLSTLGIVQGRRAFSGQAASPEELARFDSAVFFALRTLSERLFVDNTNVTYPMKAVLLLPGLMPAFDGQVRTGLQRGGFRGMKKTQYLLPDSNDADGRKITRLPFLLGECWTAFTQSLQEGVANTPCRMLVDEPGRVFDVLLFMQASDKYPVLVTLDPPTVGWHDLQ